MFLLDVLIRGTQTFTFCTQISNKFIEKNNEKYISHQNVDGRREEMRCAVKGPFRLSDYKCESGVREGHNLWIHSDSPIANAKAKLLFDTLPTILWKTLVDYLFEV